MRAVLALAIAAACVSGCADAPRPVASPSNGSGQVADPIRALFASEWDWQMTEWPTGASLLGDHRHDGRWPDVSPAGFARRAAHARELERRLRSIDPASVPAADALSFELFVRDNAEEVEGEPFRLWHLLVDQREGVQSADDLADALPFATVGDYEAWLRRLHALPAYLEQATATLREGARERIVQPKIAMGRIPAQLARQVVADPEASPFWAPVKRMPPSLPPADRDRLTRETREAIAREVVPAYRRFAEFFSGEYLPACFDQVGAWQLPRGAEAYAYLVRKHTTTKLTPEQVHDLGLREVARLRAALLAEMTRTGFKGGLPDFFRWLRTDPQFFYPDGHSLFIGYEATAKRIDPHLVQLFKTLPRTPYGVEAIPVAVAPDTTAAYYRDPAGDGSRAGTFFVNLYKPEARPRWEMMALTLHESVPGHHLQIALASEQTGLPAFRRFGSWTAFVEGWGVYAESLGEDMGLYDEPYSEVGRLAYEMWRAVRLVVDTGIHSMKWDRQRAIAYFLENTPKTELDVTNEVDRYIAWPGQALAYKIGQLEILRLREHARAQLGPRFDVRSFHDVVLREGAMPLDVLAGRVEAWIAEERRRPVEPASAPADPGP